MLRFRISRTVPVFVTALFIMFSGTVSAEDNFSSRDNLKSLANKYFDALTSHDTSILPLALNVKYTENGVKTRVGEGLWKTAGKALLTRHLIDTLRSGTHTQAVIEEKDAEGKMRPILMGVRLRYENGKITEIESIIAREKEFAMEMSPGGGANTVLATKDQDWEGIIPVGERSSRLALIAAADDYFDMFTEEPMFGTPFAEVCHRWENGFQTTKGGEFQGSTYPPGKCTPKGLGLYMKHPPRRVPVVDVEAGVAVAYVHFANSLPDFHMFKMRNGKVELIQAVIGAAAPSMGWQQEPVCKD